MNEKPETVASGQTGVGSSGLVRRLRWAKGTMNTDAEPDASANGLGGDGLCAKCGDKLTGHEDENGTHCRWCVTGWTAVNEAESINASTPNAGTERPKCCDKGAPNAR